MPSTSFAFAANSKAIVFNQNSFLEISSGLGYRSATWQENLFTGQRTLVDTGMTGDLVRTKVGQLITAGISRSTSSAYAISNDGDITKTSYLVTGDTLYSGRWSEQNHVIENVPAMKELLLARRAGYKHYELKDHLGNVRVTITDDKQSEIENGVVLRVLAGVSNYSNYYSFGMMMPGRTMSDGDGYRFGFQGQEKDDEIAGEGNSYTAEYWQYDTRVGRRWNLDPKPNPSISMYTCFANNPILFTDPLGDTIRINHKGKDGKIQSVVYTPGMIYKGDKFIEKAVADLNSINETKKGKQRISDLQESKFVYNVEEASELIGSKFQWEEKEEGGGIIYYYQKSDFLSKDGIWFDKSHITLGHELQHAWDRDRANDMYLYSFIPGTDIRRSEINAVGFANYLRAHAGETKMRTTYTGHKIFNSDDPDYFLNYPDPLRKTEAFQVYQTQQRQGSDNTHVHNQVLFKADKKTGKPVFD